MYKAVCDKCGKDCEVPFKPSGDKPVYCSDCFEKKERDGYSGRSSDRGRDRGRSSSRDRKMYSAVCDNCGKDCKVPFKPSGDKPIYCSDCFESKDKGGGERSTTGSNEELIAQLKSINNKLDKIVTAIEKPIVKKVTKKKAAVKKKVKSTTKAKSSTKTKTKRVTKKSKEK